MTEPNITMDKTEKNKEKIPRKKIMICICGAVIKDEKNIEKHQRTYLHMYNMLDLL